MSDEIEKELLEEYSRCAEEKVTLKVRIKTLDSRMDEIKKELSNLN